MPFILKRYPVTKGKNIQLFLLNEVKLTMPMVQKVLAKERVFDDNGNIIKKSQVLECDYIDIYVFQAKSKGLKPIFEEKDFALFNKPSGLIVHPTSRANKYTLLDEIHHYFGDDASLTHRIDSETSGLVLVAKNKKTGVIIKKMFENKQCKKEYLAIVKGKINKPITINKPISRDDGKIGIKMTTKNVNGKESSTLIIPIRYNDKNNTTLIKSIPKTGRQHQIRVHLASMNHPILGDPIYGINENIANDYLRKKLSSEDRLKYTGANRLMLYANHISFSYKNIEYAYRIKNTI